MGERRRRVAREGGARARPRGSCACGLCSRGRRWRQRNAGMEEEAAATRAMGGGRGRWRRSNSPAAEDVAGPQQRKRWRHEASSGVEESRDS